MKGRLFSIIVCLAIVAPLFLPTAAFAADTPFEPESGVVPCGRETYPVVTDQNGKIVQQVVNGKSVVGGTPVHPCGFKDAIELARRIIKGWIMAGATIGAMGIAYAGYLYITAMGSEEKIKHAHSIFYKVVLGIAFMLAAWLIAKVLEDTFLTKEQQQNSFLQSNASQNAQSGANTPTPSGTGFSP